VKLPFGTGAVEWMWVEVDRIDTSQVTGTLENTPVHAPGLHEGSRVTGKRADVADYALALPDGGREGAESDRVLTSPR
jgi:hypothetical protein